GANTALFSVLNGLVLRKLPVPEPDRLVDVSLADPQSGMIRMIYFEPLDAFRARQHVFDLLAPYSGGVTPIVRLPGGAPADAVVESTAPELYEMLGVRPYLGRLLTAADGPLRGAAAPAATRAGDVAAGRGPGVTSEQARAGGSALWAEVQQSSMPGALPLAEQRDLRRARITVASMARGFSDLRTRYERPVVVLVAS